MHVPRLVICLSRLLGLSVLGVSACSSPNYAFFAEPGRVQSAHEEHGNNRGADSGPYRGVKGSLLISNPEVLDFNASRESGTSTPALKLRLTVQNKNLHQNLVLDLRNQKVRFNFEAKGEFEAPFYTTHGGQVTQQRGLIAPVYNLLYVLPGEVRSVDLYFKLPPPAKTIADVRGFRLDWRLGVENASGDAPFTHVQGSAPFTRMTMNEEDQLLKPQLRAYAGDFPPLFPAQGPGFSQDEGVTRNFAVWSFDTPPVAGQDRSAEEDFPSTTTYMD